MTLMLDLRQVWNVQYNARSNGSPTPTSPNIPPATNNYSHDSWLIFVTHERSSTMRTSSNYNAGCAPACDLPKFHEMLRLPRRVTLQLHLILRLARKTALMVDSRRVTHKTSSTMRRATGIALQHHQILPLPRNSEFQIWQKNPWVKQYKNRFSTILYSTLFRQNKNRPLLICRPGSACTLLCSIQNPKFEIQNPKTEIRNHKSKIQIKSEIQNPKSAQKELAT